MLAQLIDSKTFLVCVGVSSEVFRQLSFKRHAALAYGVPVPSADGVYLPLDAVAMRMMGELSLVVGRKTAANLVLSHFDCWADAVGRAEAGDTRTMFLAVAVFDAKKGGRRETEYIVTSGTQDEITADLRGIKMDRAVTASVTGIVADVRARAKAVGVDLSQPFFPPPDHPQFRALIDEAKHQRMAALKRHHGGKQYRDHIKRKPVGRAVRAERLQ